MKDYHAGSQLRWKRYLLLQQREQAFTLIELLVVTMIVGLLAAVSLPGLMDQNGKARETEAKTQLGSLSRAQQAFHVEYQVFANSLDKLAVMGSFSPGYYNYPAPDRTDLATRVEHKANANSPDKDRGRNYAAGIYFDDGIYNIIICQSDKINDVVNVPTNRSGTCMNGTKLQ